MRRYLGLVIFMLVVGLFFSFARNDSLKERYQQAIAYEKSGQYAKAESLYVDMYQADPNNYNYYNRYKNILIQQRKFDLLLPILEERSAQQGNDTYVQLELSVLNYAMDDTLKARTIWKKTFLGSNTSKQRSYANTIYQKVLEYRLGSNFYKIVKDIRRITNNANILVNYNFSLALHYRNWRQAVEEIIHILDVNPYDLRYVRPYLFQYEPNSILYEIAIEELKKLDDNEAKILLSEIYLHIDQYALAYEVLTRRCETRQIQKALEQFAYQMYSQDEFELSYQSAETVKNYTQDDNVVASMNMLMAESLERSFYKRNQRESLIPIAFSSSFSPLLLKTFSKDDAKLIERAYVLYDSLKASGGEIAQKATMNHAKISYQIYQDIDAALNEYIDLAERVQTTYRREVLSEIARLYLAKGEYQKALTFLQKAPEAYRLMVHEEDQLLPQLLYTSIIAGDMDSLVERTNEVLALLNKNDPQYNDILSYSAYVAIIVKDSSNISQWLEGERTLLKNNMAQAKDIFLALFRKESVAGTMYALKYLDCLYVLDDKKAEATFWQEYAQKLFESDMGDYFMLKYAEFLEKNEKVKNAIEIYEEFLVSYHESMYFETIREYLRQLDKEGKP